LENNKKAEVGFHKKWAESEQNDDMIWYLLFFNYTFSFSFLSSQLDSIGTLY